MECVGVLGGILIDGPKGQKSTSRMRRRKHRCRTQNEDEEDEADNSSSSNSIATQQSPSSLLATSRLTPASSQKRKRAGQGLQAIEALTNNAIMSSRLMDR